MSMVISMAKSRYHQEHCKTAGFWKVSGPSKDAIEIWCMAKALDYRRNLPLCLKYEILVGSSAWISCTHESRGGRVFEEA